MTDSKVAQLFRTPATELLRIDPPKWEETFSDINPQDLRLLSNSLINLSVLAARMSAYIDARGGEGGRDQGHEAAIRSQNECAAKIREVFGFQYPKADLESLSA